MARAPILNHRRTTTGAEDLLNLKKFCATPQKRLDIHRFCTHNGASNTFGFAHRFRTGARAPLE